MFQKQKIDYFKRRSETLAEKVSDLEKRISFLLKENERLRKINAANEESIYNLSAEAERIRSEYSASISEAKKMQKKYKEALSSLYILKRKYKKAMENMLSEIKK